jgi:hypothetical protein
MCKMGSPMRMAAALQLCLLLSAAGARAQAEATLALDWNAPSECPDGASVMRAVIGRLGESGDSPGPTLRATGRIDRSATGYTLELRTERGERRLDGENCDELARGAALILALLIDPHAQPSEPAPVRAPPPSPPPAAQPPTPVQPVEPPGEPIDVGGYVRAELVVDVGMFPNAAFGPGLALGLTLAATSFELSAGFWPTSSLAYPDWVEDVPEAGELAQLSGFAVRLGACQRLVDGPELGICMFGEYMSLTADPDDALEDSTEESAPVWTLLAALRLALPLGKDLAVVFELGAGLPVHGARFTVEPFDEIHVTSGLVGRLRTGFELRF